MEGFTPRQFAKHMPSFSSGKHNLLTDRVFNEELDLTALDNEKGVAGVTRLKESVPLRHRQLAVAIWSQHC
jgi:hypothetical protein